MLQFCSKNILKYIATICTFKNQAYIGKRHVWLISILEIFSINKCLKANIKCTFIEEDTASHNTGSYLQRLENELLVQIHIVHLEQIGQFIFSIYNTQHYFGKSFQAPIIPTPVF